MNEFLGNDQPKLDSRETGLARSAYSGIFLLIRWLRIEHAVYVGQQTFPELSCAVTFIGERK